MDNLLKTAIELTIKNGAGSTSLLQRNLRIGHSKAEILLEEMEKMGVVGEKTGAKPRELLIRSMDEIPNQE